MSVDYENTPPEEVAMHYKAAMDSVNLINALVAQGDLDAEQLDTLDRNVRHLEIILTRPYWTDEDLTPLTNAVATGKAV